MNRIRLTKRFDFEAAHALTGYDGACRHIHGHSYVLHVTVSGYPSTDPTDPKLGMAMDFGTLKRIVAENIIDRFDHCLMLRTDSPLALDAKREYERVELFDFQPTCENILLLFVEILRHRLPSSVCLHRMQLNETSASYAEWYASDQ
ncbi:MAG: 6-carboxytetrahydropterin synthase [Prevotellaceae bacterium]|jgi:6-pyruvoyltetrahydropterin/6-carboxytetrahydropterin synthase|nr:6-carboxytetrahydropterin synthase [Prevotellaceae bacterium]